MRYGIYDHKKGMMFAGISERNKCEAYRKLFKFLGEGSYDQRYEAVPLDGEKEPDSAFKFGIWNTQTGSFQLGVSEDTEEEASKVWVDLVGNRAFDCWYQIRKIPLKRKCEVCGTEFETLQVEQIYCGKLCNRKARQKRKLERVINGSKKES